MPIYSPEEETEIVSTLREIVRDEGLIVGCDIVIRNSVNQCVVRMERGTPQFQHVAWGVL